MLIEQPEYQFMTQGFAQALAEVVRRNPGSGVALAIVGDILADRSLGLVEFAAAGLEPHDVRELIKAIEQRRAAGESNIHFLVNKRKHHD